MTKRQIQYVDGEWSREYVVEPESELILNAATVEANGRYASRLIEDYDGDRYDEDEYGYDAIARQAFVAGALWATGPWMRVEGGDEA